MGKCLPCYRMKKVTGRHTGSGRGDKVTVRGPVWNRRCQEPRQEQTRCKSRARVCALISLGLESRGSILAGLEGVRSTFRNSHGGGSGLVAWRGCVSQERSKRLPQWFRGAPSLNWTAACGVWAETKVQETGKRKFEQ